MTNDPVWLNGARVENELGLEETHLRMKSSSDYTDIAKYAGSVGLLVDRAVKRELPFGSVWLVDRDVVATCAHLVVLYRELLPALKIRFPAIGQDWEIVDTLFHPRFDLRIATEMAERSLRGPVPAMALQDHNLVLLKLSRNLSELDGEQRTTLNRKLSIPPMPRVQGLVGEVDELGLALVIQTMTNARKDGVLYISDERNRPVASLFCSDGRVVYAKFGRLTNEMAIHQMFLQNTKGQFNFRQQTKPDWNAQNPMSRPTDGLLIEAHRRMDEVPKILDYLGGADTAYMRLSESVDLNKISQDYRPFVQRIWPFLDGGQSIGQLWETVDFDDYSIYATIGELLKNKLVTAIPDLGDSLNPMQPLEMGPHQLLSPWDEVINLTVEPEKGKPQMRRGHLVGLLRPNDPYHLLHSLRLSYRAAGSPIFKGGQVIGVHCGMLPLDPELHALPQHLHQMMWVESVQQCLNAGAPKSAQTPVPAKKSQGMVRPESTMTDKITCPKCNSSMVKQARFCGTCGQKLS